MLAMIAQLLPAQAIIPIHGAVQLGSNTGRALVMFKDVRWDIFVWFCAGSIIGAVAGGNVVINLPIELIRGLLGGFILFTIWGPNTINIVSNRSTLAIGGLISTFLTMFVGATGPFVILMYRALQLGKLQLVATSAVSLIVQHALKVAVFGLLGFAFSSYLSLLILMISSGFVGTLIGKNILLSIDEQRFKWWLNIILSILALRLLWTAFW